MCSHLWISAHLIVLARAGSGTHSSRLSLSCRFGSVAGLAVEMPVRPFEPRFSGYPHDPQIPPSLDFSMLLEIQRKTASSKHVFERELALVTR